MEKEIVIAKSDEGIEVYKIQGGEVFILTPLGEWSDQHSRTIAGVKLIEIQKDEETKANAHLIAAAPELYEACKGAIAALSQHRTFQSDINAAKAFLQQALAKAEGKEV
jgi:hypothetical protein